MSAKNGKKSRRRPHEEDVSFKAPAAQAEESPKLKKAAAEAEELPKLKKAVAEAEESPKLKKTVAEAEESPKLKKAEESPTLKKAEEVTPPRAVSNAEQGANANGNNGNSDSGQSSRSRSRSNTPQSKKQNGNGTQTPDSEILANGTECASNGNNGESVQQTNAIEQHDTSTSPHLDEGVLEPLIVDQNEPEPELQFDMQESDLDAEVDSAAKGGGGGSGSRCITRRSMTRNIPTPETPQSCVLQPTALECAGVAEEEEEEQAGDDAKGGGDGADTVEEAGSVNKESHQAQYATTPPQTVTITITPPTPAPAHQMNDTSSHSDLESNCSTRAVVGSDITRTTDFLTPHSAYDDDLEVEEELEEEEELSTSCSSSSVIYTSSSLLDSGSTGRETLDSGSLSGGYVLVNQDGSVGGRSREGSVARNLTGRKSIRPEADYRKYLLERGLGGKYGAEGEVSQIRASGIKRKNLADQQHATTNHHLAQLKRARTSSSSSSSLSTPNLHHQHSSPTWFSYISSPITSLKDRFTRTTAELPQPNNTPTLTAYKTKSSLEEDTSFISAQAAVNVSVAVDAAVAEGDVVPSADVVGPEGKVTEIPVVLDGGLVAKRKSCVIM